MRGKMNTHTKCNSLLKFCLVALLSTTHIWIEAQNRTVTLSRDGLTVKDALQQIENQARMLVGYDESIIDVNRIIKEPVRNVTLEEALNIILKGTSCSYTIKDNYIVIVKANEMVKVSGRIVDENGLPLIGVGIRIKENPSMGTISDIDGNFAMEVPIQSSLEFSLIGFLSSVVKINDHNNNLRIILKENARSLDEVVVIGFGVRSKRDITTAISTISSDKVVKTVSLSPEMSMQGQMSGVQIIGNQGDPNARPTIRIRGTNTWGVSDPLYVIDGIPVKEYGAGIDGDSYTRGNINIMSMIDPNDIESISVLKDAASAAIYGVRAANGVILITTKKGKREKTTVEYSQKVGVQNQNQRIDLLDTKGYADYFNYFFNTDPNWLSLINRSDIYVFNPDYPDRYLGNNPTYDWQDASLTKNAMTQDYSVRVSGGTEKADYSTSFGYANEEGVRLGNNMERFSGAFKLNTDLNKYARVGINFRLSYGKGHSSLVPSLIVAGMIPPWQPIYDEDGLNGYAGVVEGYRANGTWNSAVKYGSMTRNNFLGQMSMVDSQNESLRLMGNAYLEIEPVSGLTLKGVVNMDNFSNNISNFSGFEASIFAYNGANPTMQPVGSVGSYEERVTTNNNRIFEFTANYAKKIKLHSVDFLFNMMNQKYNAKYSRGGTEYMSTANEDLRNLGGENQYTNVTSSKSRGALAGMLFRLGYNYDSKYYLDLTMRRDGSSRFAPKNRWGIFPGVSAAWRISSESFMEQLEWLDDLKIRASWGKLGNQEVANMAYLSPINTQPNYAWGNNPASPGLGYYSSGATVYSMANEGLMWEKTTTRNAGVDFTLLRGLNGSFEYYYKTTDGILQTVSLPPSVGMLNQPVDNIASVKNTGIELNLNYYKEIGDLSFSVGGNFTTVKNVVTKMYDGIPNLDLNIEEGQSMYYIRGYALGGMFQSSEEAVDYMSRVEDIIYRPALISGGDMWFKDLRGAPTKEDLENGINRFYSPVSDNIVDSYDQVYLGKTIPGYYYGFNLSLEYKGFDINALFTGVGDVQKVNAVKQTFLNTSAVAVNQMPEILNYWTEENKNTTIPRVRYGDPAGNTRFSDYFVENAGYLRLANTQLGYTLPQSVYKVTQNILSYARIYIGVSNLFTITKYGGLDPEDDYNPAPLIFHTGLSLRF